MDSTSAATKIYRLDQHIGHAVDGDPLTEDALSLRFSARHSDDLRYVALKGKWFQWTGTHWSIEETSLAFDLVRDSVRMDAKDFGNGKVPGGVHSAKTVAAVERMAKADRRQAATIEQWDADHFLFNAKGMTVDLRTGINRPPDPADHITKVAACMVALKAEHPLWSAFLDRITNGDKELQAFLQRYIGYCCSGETREHRFVFAYGTGANGKGTFINTIVNIFSDYATIADVGTFIASNQERHPTDVAKLHGARLVVAQETEKGRRWDESKIKTMTGGDKMTARFMRQDYFDYIPTFKLFITGNHKPRLDNVDEAMRRRLLLVPFTVKIPEEERDKELPEKLKSEWPAILRWCIEGCLEWQRIGLAPPHSVTEATADYFSDQDILQQWLEDCTEVAPPSAFVKIAELFASWKHWCDSRNAAPGNANSLSDQLYERGFERKRAAGGARGFVGLRIRPEDSYAS